MNYEDALEWFTHAIKVQEDWPDAHYGLALCSLKLKKNKEAVTHIENATKWSIEEYNVKMYKRKQRDDKRRKEILNAIAKGKASPRTMAAGVPDENSDVPISPEDDDS
jgi:tetratricopeptide (TPR) repeat protein